MVFAAVLRVHKGALPLLGIFPSVKVPAIPTLPIKFAPAVDVIPLAVSGPDAMTSPPDRTVNEVVSSSVP
jgi:hypothetical protein